MKILLERPVIGRGEKGIRQAEDQQGGLGSNNSRDNVQQISHANVTPDDSVNAKQRETTNLQHKKERQNFP